MSLPVIRSQHLRPFHAHWTASNQSWNPKKEWGGMEMFLDKQVRQNSPLMQYSYANFEKT